MTYVMSKYGSTNVPKMVKHLEIICYLYMQDGESSTVEPRGSSGATAGEGGWLTKRRKLHASEADLSSTQTVVSR